jgi:hypothetical protein
MVETKRKQHRSLAVRQSSQITQKDENNAGKPAKPPTVVEVEKEETLDRRPPLQRPVEQ